MPHEGDLAPDFKLLQDDGEAFRLSSLKGKWVILYFYPKDMTSGCTLEASEFNGLLPVIQKHNGVVVGVSRDSVTCHVRFKGKLGLGFALLSDPELVVHKLYHAYGKKVLYGKESEGTIRTTLLIDEKGKVAKRWNNVRVKNHAQTVVETLKQLSTKSHAPLVSSIKIR